MSRIGNAHIVIPAGVTVTASNNVLTVKGPKGTLTLIHRPEALTEILTILSKTALGGIEVLPIYSKLNQEANRIIIKGILGSKKQLTIHPPFITHTADNKYTKEAEEILRNGKSLK